MRSLAALLSAFLVLFAAAEDPALVAPTEALTPDQEKAKFHLPPGFEAQLVVAEPDIAKPMNLAFDAKGRLWVTSSVEYPFPAKEGKGRDTLKVLSDFGPDGRARKIETFAEGLNIPIGVLPLADRVLVHSIPSIWELKDTDGDGKADVRKELITGVGFRDTHGMTSSFTHWVDGWVYACHGYANESHLKGRDGSTLQLNSGNVYRFRPDGTKLEQFTWGQVNPFGLAFDKWGNLFSADCHSRPISLLLRGGCYSSFGKPHDGLGFVPDICKHDHGSTGICGLACLETDTVPAAFRGNLLLGNVVTNRINRDSVVWDGDVKELKEEPDFLKSDDPWFRPVDIKLGPDGAIYVADFYNCIIGHYEVDLKHPRRDRTRGRIWRIIYTGKDATPCGDPNKDWTKAPTKELLGALCSPNLAVRTLATQVLFERQGPEVVDGCKKVLNSKETTLGRPSAIWLLERFGRLASHTELVRMLDDELARTHLLRALDNRDGKDDWMHWLPVQKTALSRRLACEMMRRAMRPSLSETLIDCAEPTSPPFARHSLKIALRDRLDGKDDESCFEEFAKKGGAPLSLAIEAALGCKTPAAARFLAAEIDRGPVKIAADLRLGAFRHIGRHGNDADARKVLTFLANRAGPAEQLELVKALRQGSQAREGMLPSEVQSWIIERGKDYLKLRSTNHFAFACRWVDELQITELSPQLMEIAEDEERTFLKRLSAGIALAHLGEQRAVDVLCSLWTNAEAVLEHRQRIINAIAGIPTPAARAALADLLAAAPAELQQPLALGLASSKEGAELLLASIEAGKASPRLLQDQGLIDRVRQAKPKDHQQRLAKLTAGLQPPDARIAQLLAERRGRFTQAKPDLAKGKLLFGKNCAACHQLGGQGGKVGPQLDGIGVRGADRLLEDILDPNRNVDQAFRATLLELDDGKLLTGLLVREEGETLVMADDKGQEVRIPKKKVEQRRLTAHSPMPANLHEQIAPADFDHLLGYLLSLRAKP